MRVADVTVARRMQSSSFPPAARFSMSSTVPVISTSGRPGRFAISRTSLPSPPMSAITVVFCGSASWKLMRISARRSARSRRG